MLVEGLAPGFESSAPAEVAWQVLGGDAVEAGEPLLEAAVVGVDVVDVQMRGLGSRLARRGHGVEGNAGAAGEAGDRQTAVADEVIGRRDASGERRADGGARGPAAERRRRRRLSGRGRRGRECCPDRSPDGGPCPPLAWPARQVGPTALERIRG